MRVETAPELERDDRSVLTTGTFDGVHLGHQKILGYLVRRAREIGGVPTVVSFDPHPRQVLGGERVPLLTTLDERATLLAAHGVERFVVLPFTRDLSLLEPRAYVEDVLIGQVGLREIVIGYDHRFGRARAGGRETLEQIGAERGFSVDVIPEISEHGATVSSTRVRELLARDGDAASAAALLGRPYSISGTVVRGAGRGRTLGFPTANIRVGDPRKLVPRVGVYAVWADLGDGSRRGGMLNVGRRPTFETDGALSIEAHLFDVAADLYGRTVTLEVVARLRDERSFGGVEELVEQLRTDEVDARHQLGRR